MAKPDTKSVKSKENKVDLKKQGVDKTPAVKPVKAQAGERVVQTGDTVSVDYEGTFEGGHVFDSSAAHGQPLQFEVGCGQMIKGFDDAVVGMKKGQEKKFKLSPKEAYGDPNPQLVKKVPRQMMPQGHEPKPGMILAMTLPNGMQVPATITIVEENEVTIDLNHPLAGKTLNFKIKVVEIC